MLLTSLVDFVDALVMHDPKLDLHHQVLRSIADSLLLLQLVPFDKSTCLPGVSLIDWISDTRSQGCTNLQSLVKCLDHRDIVSDTVCSQAKVALDCAMH
jgi:hypothetical protein